MKRFSDRMHFKADTVHGRLVEQISPIEQEGWTMHRRVDFFEVERLELIPFCQDCNGVGVVGGFVAIVRNGDIVFDQPAVVLCQVPTHVGARK